MSLKLHYNSTLLIDKILNQRLKVTIYVKYLTKSIQHRYFLQEKKFCFENVPIKPPAYHVYYFNFRFLTYNCNHISINC